jgi:hypothetical protein
MSSSLITRYIRRIRPALAGLFVLAANAACQAQSCALCYTQAGGAGHRFIQGLRTGILVLIVPPMFMSVGITVMAYRKRNRCNDEDSSRRESESDW